MTPRIDVVNPATEEIISRIPDGRAEDARKAIDAADRAQPQWGSAACH